jgi:hypothetical protein
MLGFHWHGMLIFVQPFFDLLWHGYVQCSGHIIPIQLDTAVQVACPIYGKLIFVFSNACNQMVDMFFVNVFHSKIINY